MSRPPFVPALIALITTACGTIKGEVIQGEGNSARAAANLPVYIYTPVEAFEARCELITEARKAGYDARVRHEDSVRRAAGAVQGGYRHVDVEMDKRVLANAVGDGAMPVVTRRDSALRAMPTYSTAWEGRTDLQGRFKSEWLVAGEYVVEVAGLPHRARVVAGGPTLQLEYSGFSFPSGCSATPGEL